jgi:phage FluMu protein Com
MNLRANYLDGNVAGGELSRIFAIDVTSAEAKCAHCGTIKRFAEAQVYLDAPGLVARCVNCEHVLLRVANIRQRTLLDVRGMTYLSFDAPRLDSRKPAGSQ